MSIAKRILGIDHGFKRVGIATGDSEQKIALPLEIIENKGLGLVLEKIKSICREEKIDQVIVGLPVGLSGGKSRQTLQTEEFIRRLKDELTIPVLAEDERLSTKEAEKLFRGKMGSGKDDLAAMLILQSYLDKIP